MNRDPRIIALTRRINRLARESGRYDALGQERPLTADEWQEQINIGAERDELIAARNKLDRGE